MVEDIFVGQVRFLFDLDGFPEVGFVRDDKVQFFASEDQRCVEIRFSFCISCSFCLFAHLVECNSDPLNSQIVFERKHHFLGLNGIVADVVGEVVAVVQAGKARDLGRAVGDGFLDPEVGEFSRLLRG